MSKNEILDAVENTVVVFDRFGNERAEGHRVENNSQGFTLSGGEFIKFSQVASVQAGKVVLA